MNLFLRLLIILMTLLVISMIFLIKVANYMEVWRALKALEPSATAFFSEAFIHGLNGMLT